jgi:hypothetical protein
MRGDNMGRRAKVPYSAIYPRATTVGPVTVVDEVSGEVLSVESSQLVAVHRYTKKCQKMAKLPNWVAPDGYGFRFHRGRPTSVILSDGTVQRKLGELTGRVYVDRGGPVSRMFKRRRE